jgi:hypothetical protein
VQCLTLPFILLSFQATGIATSAVGGLYASLKGFDISSDLKIDVQTSCPKLRDLSISGT